MNTSFGFDDGSSDYGGNGGGDSVCGGFDNERKLEITDFDIVRLNDLHDGGVMKAECGLWSASFDNEVFTIWIDGESGLHEKKTIAEIEYLIKNTKRLF